MACQLFLDLIYCKAPAGLPGNDDQAAMATFLAFHLLGLYPGAYQFINRDFMLM